MNAAACSHSHMFYIVVMFKEKKRKKSQEKHCFSLKDSIQTQIKDGNRLGERFQKKTSFDKM